MQQRSCQRMFIKYLSYSLQRGHNFGRSVRERHCPPLLSDHAKTQGCFSQKTKKKCSKDSHKKIAFYFAPENKKEKAVL